MLYFLKNGLVEGAIYALIALGYTMVYGILGMINFAHGEIYMLGAYAGVLAIGVLMSTGVVAASLPLAILLAFLFGVVVCSLWGATMEKVAYRPLRNAPPLAPLISAIGASFFLWNFVMVFQGNVAKEVPPDVRSWLVDETLPITSDLRISYLEIGILSASIIMMIALQIFIHHTRLGKAMRATAQDRTMASLVGIPVNRVITATFLIGSGLAAVAGIMFAMYTSVILYLDGYLPGMKAFTAAVLGGIGNVPGAMLGGFALGIAENLAMWGPSRWLLPMILAGLIFGGTAYVIVKRLRPDAIGLRNGVVLIAVAVGVVGKWMLANAGVFVPVLDEIGGRTDYKHVYAFLILLLVLVFRPRGILGERVSEKV